MSSEEVMLIPFQITCEDDCLAFKGYASHLGALDISELTRIRNSTNVYSKGIKWRGGNGIAIGSLGQYVGMVSLDAISQECLTFISTLSA